MTAPERFEAKNGPFTNFFGMYCGNADATAKGLEPYFNGWLRANLEIFSLMSRRAQAYVAIPQRIASCRSPQDVYNEQVRFWQSAMADYSEGSKRIMSAMAACSLVPGQGATDSASSPRDYITFPEPEAAPQKKAPSRKAA